MLIKTLSYVWGKLNLLTLLFKVGLLTLINMGSLIYLDKWINMDSLIYLDKWIHFSFQGQFFEQVEGAAMGSPVSPIVANLYMEYLEQKA